MLILMLVLNRCLYWEVSYGEKFPTEGLMWFSCLYINAREALLQVLCLAQKVLQSLKVKVKGRGPPTTPIR